MATTTNYGWVTPDDTALVKDGAAAIRTLGTSADTTVYNNDQAAIKKTIIAAKGDLISATANDTPSILSVGANGTTLVADSSEATGLKWQAPAGGGKVLQVVSAVISTQATITTTSFADSNITLAITPTSATSKILVMVSAAITVYRDNTVAGGVIKLMRGATDIWNDHASADYSLQTSVGNNGGNFLEISTYSGITYLDSPATTSSITYKIQGKRSVFSPTANASITFQNNLNTSTITLLEIGA